MKAADEATSVKVTVTGADGCESRLTRKRARLAPPSAATLATALTTRPAVFWSTMLSELVTTRLYAGSAEVSVSVTGTLKVLLTPVPRETLVCTTDTSTVRDSPAAVYDAGVMLTCASVDTTVTVTGASGTVRKDTVACPWPSASRIMPTGASSMPATSASTIVTCTEAAGAARKAPDPAVATRRTRPPCWPSTMPSRAAVTDSICGTAQLVESKTSGVVGAEASWKGSSVVGNTQAVAAEQSEFEKHGTAKLVTGATPHTPVAEAATTVTVVPGGGA